MPRTNVSVKFSPQTHSKIADAMAIPRWKKAEMEKGKSTDPKAIEQKKSDPKPTAANRVTAPSTVAAAAAPAAKVSIAKPATAQKPELAAASKAMSKIPLLTAQSASAVRDPRLMKNAANASSNADASNAAQTSIQGAPLTSANAGERKSVKERLGTRLVGQGLFSNLKNTTSFVIQSSTQKMTPAQSSEMANRVNQPIPLLSIPIVTEPSAENFIEPIAQPLLQTIPPAFARKSQRQADTQLIIPSFATGAQKVNANRQDVFYVHETTNCMLMFIFSTSRFSRICFERHAVITCAMNASSPIANWSIGCPITRSFATKSTKCSRPASSICTKITCAAIKNCSIFISMIFVNISVKICSWPN